MSKKLTYHHTIRHMAKYAAWVAGGAMVLAATGLLALQVWYGWYAGNHALSLDKYDDRGTLILDREGSMLHMFAASDGIFRLKSDVGGVDKRYLDTLVAFEDKRFYSHSGVDYLALIRATGQALKNGRIISGGSTITMQVARLLEPRERTWQAKLIEMARAAQLEERFSKDEILGLYLTLAPYGGAYEGVRAASWHYFGREPKNLTWGEAALLTVLPQSPSRFRPDRHPLNAARARDKVLARVKEPLNISDADLTANKGFRLRLANQKGQRAPALHLAFRLKDRKDSYDTVATTINTHYQSGATQTLKQATTRLAPTMSAAAVIVDSWSGQTIAYVGSPDYFNNPRTGAVDMVKALRSPGSTLKPFIYGLGFDDGFLHPLTHIRDEKTRFGDYAPNNFRDRFHGEVTVQYALQKSLNIPAVKILSRVGADRFAAELSNAGTPLSMPGRQGAGLALALGGAGISLENLVKLYSALASDGRVRGVRLEGNDALDDGIAIVSPEARAYLNQMLKGVAPPADLLPASLRQKGRQIAFKTGTSWGFRDALAIGFDERWVIGVWVGKPDGTPSPGHYGARTAAPILFDLMAMMPQSDDGDNRQRQIKSPANVPLNWDQTALAPMQRHFDLPPMKHFAATAAPAPVIQFPIPDSAIKLPKKNRPVFIETTGGDGTLSLLVNGQPITTLNPQGSAWWHPDGIGFHRITVVDQVGQATTASVRIVP